MESKAQLAVGRIAGVLLAHSLKMAGGPKTMSDVVQEIGAVVKEYFDPDVKQMTYELAGKVEVTE